MKNFLALIATSSLVLFLPVKAADTPTHNYSNKEMFANFTACAANAAVLGDRYDGELELYMNAAIDIGFEASDGKANSSVVLQGIKETVQNIKALNYSVDYLTNNYKQHCGYGDTRGYASWYHNQRENMKVTVPKG